MSIPKLYLNMIVKNESRVILRLLRSVLPLIDGYCICDTGSTDNTVNLIRTFFKMANLPGIIVNEPFRDFGYNRSFALKQCLTIPGITKNDYILLMDADMVLTGPVLEKEKIEEFKRSLTHDVYLMMQGSNTFHYKNARIVKNRGFSYWGVTHEYLQTPDGTSYHLIDKSELFIQDIGDGGAKSDKWERDIRLLTKGLEDEPTASRYAFYLANSYRDSGNTIKAIEYYKKRIEMGGWIEEVWHSYYSAGKCYMNINDIPNAIHMFLEGYQYYPNRIEGLYFLINYYRNHAKNKNAYNFYKIANESRKIYGGASDNFLFLERDIYEYKLDYELTIIGYYENHDNFDLKRISMNILSKSIVEDGIYRNILSNYKFYVSKAIQSAVPIDNNLLSILNSIGSTLDIDLNIFLPSTPSLCFLNNTTLIVNKRYVNYSIDNNGGYVNRENIITQNVIAVINISREGQEDQDEKYILQKEYILESDKSLDNHYIGLEDIRLHTGEDGKLYYNANRGFGYNNIQVEHGEIEYDILDSETYSETNKTLCLTSKNRILKKDGAGQVEKNWVLFNSGNNIDKKSLHCIYGWSPLIIGEIKGDNFNVVSEQSNMPAFFKHIRGSTNGQVIGDEIWFICHLVSYESRRYYYHIVVVLDKTTRQLKKYTNMFLFERETVEYTLGFIESVNNKDNLLIGYSLLDRETKYMEVPKKWFEDQMILV
jgi:tetratricopeptide (TPR) repeat protein